MKKGQFSLKEIPKWCDSMPVANFACTNSSSTSVHDTLRCVANECDAGIVKIDSSEASSVSTPTLWIAREALEKSDKACSLWRCARRCAEKLTLCDASIGKACHRLYAGSDVVAKECCAASTKHDSSGANAPSAGEPSEASSPETSDSLPWLAAECLPALETVRECMRDKCSSMEHAIVGGGQVNANAIACDEWPCLIRCGELIHKGQPNCLAPNPLEFECDLVARFGTGACGKESCTAASAFAEPPANAPIANTPSPLAPALHSSVVPIVVAIGVAVLLLAAAVGAFVFHKKRKPQERAYLPLPTSSSI